MYIVKVLIEHPVHSLDMTFDYLSHQKIMTGVRVNIIFNHRRIVGYVEDEEYTTFTKEQLEEKAGFSFSFIESVIDEEPLLNEELKQLASTLSKLTMSPRISCLQAMLPTQLKPSTHKAVGIKYVKTVVIKEYGKAKTKKQQECLDYLKEYQELSLKDIPYSKAILDKLEEQGLICYRQVENYRNPYIIEEKKQVVTLTKQQQNIVNQITSKEPCVSLIHGVTGSGKTEVYLSLASYYIQRGKNVIMLVPEISLTPMMVKVFKERFGEKVAILHSRLSSGEKYDEYRKIKRQEVHIIVGARSAIFAPIENIGLIILDEEHDGSYKQESHPRYHTAQVAKIRAKSHHAHVVLGSATPSLESYSRALKGVYDLYELKERINQKPLPYIEIIDMVESMKQNNYTPFSYPLRKKIQETIDKGEQVILLLNKRGYASVVRCNDCGEVVKCPHCDVTLTYHKEEGQLKCHYCDYTLPLVKTCPNCQSSKIKLIGYGTEKIEETIEKTFHHASVIRYDVDTTRNKNSHLKLLERFRNKEANILLGTQMIAKGLDFENVTFVGVLNADLSLNIPDYRSSERTFQLLCQVAGRSGRGNKSGTVMIQTYNPDHYVIEAVKTHDYQAFYQEEMKYRRLAKYPPYCHMVSLIIQSKKEEDVRLCASEIAQYLNQHLTRAQVLGPAKSMIYKMQDIYRERILVKFFDGRMIYENLNKICDYYSRNKRKVTIVCDFNPYSQI